VNAPEAGTIKEFLANEEDTVVVGQDLVRMESGGAPAAKEETAPSEPKEPASKEQPTASDPKPAEKSEPAPKKEEKPAQQPKKETAPKKAESKPETAAPVLGDREERRVREHEPWFSRCAC